ncbi:hypothetical protein POM88_025182 [Heracleum sosnowskyi]|uniref:Protease Do-like PDZ domain-containing protein n=1 Tax=Heracleum sosnowskyi TaxID=360622 RepID=A0AAD8MNL5_9APIA|nr:hypothetical protein POM88_025182 [Heracleum sosnowskyi]
MIVPITYEDSNNKWTFLKPLKKDLWLTSIAFFIFNGFAVWVLEHRINTAFRGPPSQHVGMICWFPLSIVVFAHSIVLFGSRTLPLKYEVDLIKVLVADFNIGYEEIVNTQVHAFNGKPVKNLKGLAYMVEKCDEEFLKFHLEYEQIIVLQTEKAKAATPDILTTHCIPSAMSDDLKA